MIYLTQASTEIVREAIRSHPRLGQLITPGSGHKPLDGVTWAADNGAFTESYPGDDGYLEMLERKGGAWRSNCLFAPAPDVVADWSATLDLSLPMLGRLRGEGWPAALVAQDGAEFSDWRDLWPLLDAVFLGGSTEWKLGPAAAALVREARAQGKHVHMGRVNSGKRFRYADWLGCGSADGTFIARAPDKNLRRMRAWLDEALWIEGVTA